MVEARLFLRPLRAAAGPSSLLVGDVAGAVRTARRADDQHRAGNGAQPDHRTQHHHRSRRFRAGRHRAAQACAAGFSATTEIFHLRRKNEKRHALQTSRQTGRLALRSASGQAFIAEILRSDE